MAGFVYKAIDREGKIVRGVLDAENISVFYELIQEYRMFVLSVRERSSFSTALSRITVKRSVTRPEIMEFANNMAIMVKAGLPVTTSIDDIARSTDNKYFSEKLLSIKRRVTQGESLSSAASEEKGLFPDIFLRLIKIGEETGRLDSSLQEIARYLQTIEDFTAAVKKAVIYPLFAVATTLIAMFFWIFFVMPKLVELFQSMEVELPLITQLIIAGSDMAREKWYIILGVIFAIPLIIKIAKRNKIILYAYDQMTLRLPVIKLIAYNKLLALFSEQMRILVAAGVPIDRILTLMEDVIGNEVFRRAIHSVSDSIMSGNSVSDSLKSHSIFPSLFVRMIKVGEESGSLDEQLGFLSDYYLKKLKDISDKMEKMIEPIVMGVVGGIFIVMIVSLLLPVFNLISNVGGR